MNFEFNIADVEYEESYENGEYGTKTLYFIAPREWVYNFKPEARWEAVSGAISLEYPVDNPDPKYATVMMSPTRAGFKGSLEDYDWFDIDLSSEDIEALISLAESK